MGEDHMKFGLLCSGLTSFLFLTVLGRAQDIPPQFSSKDAPASHVEIASPNGRLTIAFEIRRGHTSTKDADELVYVVTYGGKPLVNPSPIKVDLLGQPPLGPNMRIDGSEQSSKDETYHLLAGKASTVRDHYNAIRINLVDQAGPPHNDAAEVFEAQRRFQIEARAYDDGVAFRYIVPEQPALREFRMTQEETEFRIAKDATTYAQELPDYRSQYESEYIKLPITGFVQGDNAPGPRLIGLPLLMEVPGVAWMAITEADMRGNAAMYLVNPLKYSVNATWSGLMARISPSVKDPQVAVTGLLPHPSPWRVILVGDEPGRLIESNIITSLNPPSAIQDTSWIHPGRASWEWWSGRLNAEGKREFSTKNMEYYVDFSAKAGLEYMLVDSDWSAPDDLTKMNGTIDIPELVKYAQAKHVKIWIWCHWALLDAQLEEAFAQFEKWGVAGVKTDFLSRDDQAMIEFYYRSAEAAARHHLLIDYHGATKPTGLERTWPNVLGYEGLLGMEQSHSNRRDNPDHHLMIPFTRMLAGPMDYTPGGFRNVTKAEFEPLNEMPVVMGTRAHHLAMYAVYQAAVQMVSDYPKAYENQPSFAFIQEAPTTWDETRVLNGLPGEYITITRRHGDDWFLGAMTNWTPRELDLPLSFLGKGKFTAEIYEDAPDSDIHPTDVKIRKETVDSSAHLKEKLVSAGGLAVRFVPIH